MIRIRVIKEGGAIRELRIPVFVWGLVLSIDRMVSKLEVIRLRVLDFLHDLWYNPVD